MNVFLPHTTIQR